MLYISATDGAEPAAYNLIVVLSLTPVNAAPVEFKYALVYFLYFGCVADVFVRLSAKSAMVPEEWINEIVI
jgi:hypothetical protein